MKLLLLFGDAAVGKMTVGQELCKITDFRLFHNHMSIEPVLEVFGEFNGTVIRKFRETVFEEFAKTDKYGLIFTFMWAFDCKEDWSVLMIITKSPQSTLGVKMALCLPLRRVAASAATLPSGLPAASITYHLRSISSAFGINVDIILSSKSNYCFSTCCIIIAQAAK